MLWGRRSKAHCPEARYLRGELRPRSDRPSVVHFTLHKCASVYLRSKLHALARKIGLAPLDLDGYFFDFARPEPFTLTPRGFFYGPFRGLDDSTGVPRQWPDLSPYKIIIVLRDPRDVLTSLYFSIAYSHRTPRGDGRDEFLSHRDQVKRVDIDDYVRQAAEQFYPRYRAYFDLASRYDAHLTTYEQLVTAPQAWLNELLAYLDVRLSSWTRRRLISANDFAVDHENPDSHVRQVAPGDHARKLRPDTIAFLNAKFGDVLAWNEGRQSIRRAA